jgi:hypothetical protein
MSTIQCKSMKFNKVVRSLRRRAKVRCSQIHKDLDMDGGDVLQYFCTPGSLGTDDPPTKPQRKTQISFVERGVCG